MWKILESTYIRDQLIALKASAASPSTESRSNIATQKASYSTETQHIEKKEKLTKEKTFKNKNNYSNPIAMASNLIAMASNLIGLTKEWSKTSVSLKT